MARLCASMNVDVIRRQPKDGIRQRVCIAPALAPGSMCTAVITWASATQLTLKKSGLGIDITWQMPSSMHLLTIDKDDGCSKPETKSCSRRSMPRRGWNWNLNLSLQFAEGTKVFASASVFFFWYQRPCSPTSARGVAHRPSAYICRRLSRAASLD